eukprot:13668454-Alexandrium_andersonii.AAC.1
MERVCVDMPFRPPHECLEQELSDDPSLLSELQRQRADAHLPPAYYEHPVVVAAGDDPVVPLALYMDGVAYSDCDSTVGIWMVNLVNGA